MMSNPMDSIERFDLDALPVDCPEVREYIAELNLIFAKIKELCELQEKNLDINLFPTLYRLLGRTDQINKSLQSITERTNDE